VKEVGEAIKQSSQLHRDKNALEAELRNVNQHYREKIRQKDAELDVAERRVTDETDYRSVDCQELFDYGKGKVSVVRLDTGETIEETDMTPEQRQVEMELAEAAGG
jgi:hypothetical protein